MDTSPEYILQCKQAGEIQILAPARLDWAYNGAFWSNTDGDDIIIGGSMGEENIPDNYTWLPRQDQLQEMMGLKVWALWAEFDSWLENETVLHNSDYLYEVGSFEQLWLAFVMKELYNKVWSGEEWETLDKVN